MKVGAAFATVQRLYVESAPEVKLAEKGITNDYFDNVTFEK
jgi:hypothetical protein